MYIINISGGLFGIQDNSGEIVAHIDSDETPSRISITRIKSFSLEELKEITNLIEDFETNTKFWG